MMILWSCPPTPIVLMGIMMGLAVSRRRCFGRVVCDFLLQHFPTVFDVVFTARMEAQLDNIANGETRWQAVMAEMWTPLAQQVSQAATATATSPKIKVAVPPAQGSAKRARGGKRAAKRKPKAPAKPVGRACPKCGQPLVERKSKYGPFVGCSGFPTCRFTGIPEK